MVTADEELTSSLLPLTGVGSTDAELISSPLLPLTGVGSTDADVKLAPGAEIEVVGSTGGDSTCTRPACVHCTVHTHTHHS